MSERGTSREHSLVELPDDGRKGGAPTPPSTSGSKPAPSPQTKTKPKPVTLIYKYLTAQHKTVTGHAKLVSCRATFTGKGTKRHQTGTSSRLALTIRGLTAPRGSHVRLSYFAATVGTGTARGSSASLTITRPSLKSGRYRLLVHERRQTKRITLQVHVS